MYELRQWVQLSVHIWAADEQTWILLVCHVDMSLLILCGCEEQWPWIGKQVWGALFSHKWTGGYVQILNIAEPLWENLW